MKHPEDDLQKAVVGMLDLYQNMGRLTYFAVPNGGQRSKVEAKIMKGLGVRAGVPDLCILIASGPTLFIELKAAGRKPSDAQKEWGRWINSNGGYRTANVCWTLEAVHALVKDGLQQAKVAA